jgi:hypothetical protein
MSIYRKFKKAISKRKTAKGIVNAANAFFEKNNIQGSARFEEEYGNQPVIGVEDDFFPYAWAYNFALPDDSPFYAEAENGVIIVLRKND